MDNAILGVFVSMGVFIPGYLIFYALIVCLTNIFNFIGNLIRPGRKS